MQPLLIDLSGKTALVTGASGELGRVMAMTLARSGADVAIHYFQNQAKAQELCEKIKALGRRAFVVQADATCPESVKAMQVKIIAEFGCIDLLILNAVKQYIWKPLLEQDPMDYLGQFESTVMQTVHLTQAFVPAMIAKGQGRVIGINTECTMQCLPTQSAYVAGKRGMDGVLRVLAREVGPSSITVNQVAPGWTVSDKDRTQHSERNEGYEQGVPLRRRGTDQEVANVVAFLASDLASFITGAYIPVSGGNVMPTV
jgi:3-oxoacyl-[acyl-carrier protein] reductase